MPSAPAAPAARTFATCERAATLPAPLFSAPARRHAAVRLRHRQQRRRRDRTVRQWTAPSPRKPYRYGGAVIIDYAETAAEHHMITAAATLIELLDPAGLVSFDFLVSKDTRLSSRDQSAPRRDARRVRRRKGNLFRAHVEAGLGNDLWQGRNLPERSRRARGAALCRPGRAHPRRDRLARMGRRPADAGHAHCRQNSRSRPCAPMARPPRRRNASPGPAFELADLVYTSSQKS